MAAIQEICNEIGFELIEHPLYSPQLSPNDFCLFPQLKKHLRGSKFEDDSEVVAAVEAFWNSQDNDFFSKGTLV